MPHNGLASHCKHAVGAFKYSLEGLRSTFREETAFKQETLALALLPLLAWLLGASGGHICLVVCLWLAVMAIELLNSAVENLCNLVSPEYDLLVKRAKDAGSAAVFIGICANIAFWLYLIYFYSRIV